jgi:hypothetical protein
MGVRCYSYKQHPTAVMHARGKLLVQATRNQQQNRLGVSCASPVRNALHASTAAGYLGPLYRRLCHTMARSRSNLVMLMKSSI